MKAFIEQLKDIKNDRGCPDDDVTPRGSLSAVFLSVSFGAAVLRTDMTVDIYTK